MEKGDILISNGYKDLQNWEYCANQVISNMGDIIIHYSANRNNLKQCKIGSFIQRNYS